MLCCVWCWNVLSVTSDWAVRRARGNYLAFPYILGRVPCGSNRDGWLVSEGWSLYPVLRSDYGQGVDSHSHKSSAISRVALVSSCSLGGSTVRFSLRIVEIGTDTPTGQCLCAVCVLLVVYGTGTLRASVCWLIVSFNAFQCSKSSRAQVANLLANWTALAVCVWLLWLVFVYVCMQCVCWD